MIANHTKTEESLSTKTTKSNKRSIKLEKKLISKVCWEVDLAKSQGRALPQMGIKQTETISGNFSTLIIELSKECLHNLA